MKNQTINGKKGIKKEKNIMTEDDESLEGVGVGMRVGVRVGNSQRNTHTHTLTLVFIYISF